MRYSFDTIDIKRICDKIKTYTRLQDGPSYLQITAQMNVTKRKFLILIKKSIAGTRQRTTVVKDDVSTPWCVEINQGSYLKL